MYASPWLQTLLLPRLWDVCGILVKPLSVWHVYVLQTSGNPYIKGGDVDLDSATEVLLYASSTLQEGRRLYWEPHYRAKRRKRIVNKIRRLEWDNIHAAISEYVAACCRTPGHKEKIATPNDPAGKPMAAPPAWVYAEYFSRTDPKQIDDAFNMQFSLAACLFDAGRNVRGEDDSLISEEDEERIDAKLERMAEMKKAAEKESSE